MTGQAFSWVQRSSDCHRRRKVADRPCDMRIGSAAPLLPQDPVVFVLDASPSQLLKIEQKPVKLETESNNSKDCFILSPPILGSFHILFRIKFGDGAQWALKVPATGHPDRFDASDAKALTSEALTMRLIKREITLPIPEVYSFNASTHNDLGCPFILMEYIKAVPLHEIWFEETAREQT